MRNYLYLLLLCVFCSCGGAGTSGSKGWEYSTSVNEMDDSKTYLAKIEALEKLEFKFPYNGGTQVGVTVRNQSSENDVMLRIPKGKGQFIGSIMGDKVITMRFDDNPAIKVKYDMPADYSSETIFLRDADNIIKNLKSAETLIVQCEFFNEGTQTMKFDVAGFEWEH